MTESEFRKKVIWFTFLFSLLVVWVHSYNAELFLGWSEDAADVYWAEHLIGDFLGQIAVPGFFMISGYLFYRGFRWEMLWGKWNRRIRSLLVPFILWNFLYYIGYVTGSRLPWMTDVVGKGRIPFTLGTAIDAVINYTYNYVFWYLYQLIALTLLAPVLYLLLKRWQTRIGLMAVLWWMAWKDIQLPAVNVDALIYYGTAASLAMVKNKRIWSPEESWSPCRAFVGAVFVLLSGWAYFWGLSRAIIPGFVLCRLLAVAGLWLILPEEKLPKPRDFMNYSFFLYATHFALVRLINKTAARLWNPVKWEPFALFLVMPVLVLAISYLVGKWLRRYLPSCWKLLNGFR